MIKLKRHKTDERQAANQQLIKETNLTLIFNLINRDGPVSRAELAQMTRLSPTTVSSLTEELLYNEIIMETGIGTTSTSGRKPIMLEVNSQGGYVVSVEMLSEGFNLILYDLKCNEITGRRLEVSDYSSIGRDIVTVINEVLNQNNISDDRLFGVCIGIPGLIDYKNNRVLSSTVVDIDENNSFYSDIKEIFNDIPVLIGNESCFCAYAEKEFGISGYIKNLIFIDINVGVGAGIILDGKIFPGSFGQAGEIGHMSIDMNGPKCKCGNRGCLEVMTSIPAIMQKIIVAVMSGRETLINEFAGNDLSRINIDIVKRALDENDVLTKEIIREKSEELASGINNVANLFNPQVIVIGGEITKLGHEFLENLKKNVLSIGLKPNIEKMDIKYSCIEKNTVNLGGAKYLLDNIFNTAVLGSKNYLYNLSHKC